MSLVRKGVEIRGGSLSGGRRAMTLGAAAGIVKDGSEDPFEVL